MTTVIINDKEYELTNEPTHGVVRKVRRKQKELMISLIEKHSDIIKPTMALDEAIGIILKEKPEDMREYTLETEEFESIATISLATGYMFTYKDFDDCSEKEFWNIYDKCVEVLGGNVTDFFARYEKSITSQTNTKNLKHER